MQKQPASDSGLPAQAGDAGTPAKPSTAQAPKPSPIRPGQSTPKPSMKPAPMAKPKPSAQAPVGGSQVAEKPAATSSVSSAAKPKPASVAPINSKAAAPNKPAVSDKPAAPKLTSDSEKSAAKPVGSPASFAKPKPRSSVTPKSVVPVAEAEKPNPSTENITQPSGAATPAKPAKADTNEHVAPAVPKPGTAQPARDTKRPGGPLSQPQGVKMQAKNAEQPLPSADSLAKPATAKPMSPKKPSASVNETKPAQAAAATPQAKNEESKVDSILSNAATTAAPSTPMAPPASKESVEPADIKKAAESEQKIKAAEQVDKAAEIIAADTSAQQNINAAQAEATNMHEPTAQLSEQRPIAELSDSSTADSSTSSGAPRAESDDALTDVSKAGSADADGTEEPGAPAAGPTTHSDSLEPATPAAPAAENASTPGSSGLMTLLLGVSFVLEVALLGAVAFGAMWALPQLNPIVAILVTVLPLMILWGLFMSPKASFRIASVMHAILAHTLFVGGSVLLFLAGQPVLGIGMGVLTLLSLVLTLMVGGQGAITEAMAARKAQAGGSPRTGKGSGRRAAR